MKRFVSSSKQTGFTWRREAVRTHHSRRKLWNSSLLFWGGCKHNVQACQLLWYTDVSFVHLKESWNKCVCVLFDLCISDHSRTYIVVSCRASPKLDIKYRWIWYFVWNSHRLWEGLSVWRFRQNGNYVGYCQLVFAVFVWIIGWMCLNGESQRDFLKQN